MGRAACSSWGNPSCSSSPLCALRRDLFADSPPGCADSPVVSPVPGESAQQPSSEAFGAGRYIFELTPPEEEEEEEPSPPRQPSSPSASVTFTGRQHSSSGYPSSSRLSQHLAPIIRSPGVVRPISAAESAVLSPSSPAEVFGAEGRYVRLECVGEGTFGKVHRCWDNQMEEYVAVKRSKPKEEDEGRGGIPIATMREMKLMQRLQGVTEHVLTFRDVILEGGRLSLVLDYMDTDLRRVLKDADMVLTEKHVKCLFRQLMEGLGACHNLGFVHRDLAPSNVLLTRRNGLVKLADFGSARTFGGVGTERLEQPPVMMTKQCTTLWYRAPELLYGSRTYSETVDIWSAGCVLAEMLNRRVLFEGRGEIDMLSRIFETRGSPSTPDPEDPSVTQWPAAALLPNYLEFPESEPRALKDMFPTGSAAACRLVGTLLRLDPACRASAKQVLEAKEEERTPGGIGQTGFLAPGTEPVACLPTELPFLAC